MLTAWYEIVGGEDAFRGSPFPFCSACITDTRGERDRGGMEVMIMVVVDVCDKYMRNIQQILLSKLH